MFNGLSRRKTIYAFFGAITGAIPGLIWIWFFNSIAIGLGEEEFLFTTQYPLASILLVVIPMAIAINYSLYVATIANNHRRFKLALVIPGITLVTIFLYISFVVLTHLLSY